MTSIHYVSSDNFISWQKWKNWVIDITMNFLRTICILQKVGWRWHSFWIQVCETTWVSNSLIPISLLQNAIGNQLYCYLLLVGSRFCVSLFIWTEKFEWHYIDLVMPWARAWYSEQIKEYRICTLYIQGWILRKAE